MYRHRGVIAQIAKINWFFFIAVTLVCSIGFAVLYSAAEGNLEPWCLKQILRFVLLIPLTIMVALIDTRVWFKYSYFLYFAALILLIMIFLNIFAVTALGATRWVRLGPVNVQPADLMKVFLVFALARYFHQSSIVNVHRVVHLILPIIMIIFPALLIMKQPDLGTALILIMVGGAMFFAAGVKIWKFALVGVGAIAAMPVAWHFMHDYQKERVTTFLEPDKDPLGVGYHIMQSKIAIGSGGFFGKGFLHGTQSQLSFLPEKQTDFIFTMYSEEFGLIGALILLILYSVIIFYGILISVRCANHYGRMLAIGIISIFFFHIFINIAMVMGMLPAVGVPLPLLSYGGTIMTTMMISFGLLLGVDLHRDQEWGSE